jgi:putative addiction module component (TIGR02574 family)
LSVLRTSVYNQAMTERAQAVLRDAMLLAADERANVAAELLASLDDSVSEDPAAVQAAWAKEIERRARRVLAGESSGQPWDDIRDRVARRLKQT